MKKKILIIDDDEELVEGQENTLILNGFSVVTATSGSEGFEKAN